ncbi:major facilitator superfamily domain-containing protein [Melanogaster broomeanus]|nr:major facilitator superfamily domain-containing protein [Melanogaster broomeanus]
MSSQNVDEETPLLRQEPQESEGTNSKKQRTPLPWRQFSILLLLQVSEPLTSQVIAPFLPQARLIRDIGITNGEESRVGYYVGLMYSLFFLTEACTIFHWSRVSDQIGRKPVLLTGLFGLSLSMYCFGLSTTFWGLVISRCLNGALNGNIGIMKSMVAEMTDSTNMAQAYSILPFTWGFGTTVGPLIGGSLERPADRFPEIFGNSAFLKKYPYFLPCSIPATVTALSWIVAFVFLKEFYLTVGTAPVTRGCLIKGNYLTSSRRTNKPTKTLRQLLFGGGKDNADTPRIDSSVPTNPLDGPLPQAEAGQLPFRALLIRPVLIAAGSYATLSLVEIAFRAVVPVFLATPIEMGGLNLDPPTIGNLLSLVGLSNGILQWAFFARMHDWLGAKTMFLVTVSAFLPIIALYPAISFMARSQGLGISVWCLVGLQMTLFIFANFAFGLTFMFVSAAAPNRASIGATNGLAQMLVSFMRAIGPVIVNSAFSLSIEKHIMGGYFAYWVMAVMVGLALWVGFLLPKNMWNNN